MSLCHLKHTYFTIYLPQSSPSMETFSKSIKTHYSDNFAKIWPNYGKSLLSLFFIEWGTRWDVTKEKLSSRMPGLIRTFIFFLSVTFFTIIDHWVCVGSWLKTVQPHLSNCQEMKTPTWEAGEKWPVIAAAEEWGSNLTELYLSRVRVTSSRSCCLCQNRA